MKKEIDFENIYDKFNNKLHVGDEVYFPYTTSSYCANIGISKIIKFEYRGGYLCAMLEHSIWKGFSVKKLIKKS